MNPDFPVYVISKGRWESRLTVKALGERHIPHHVVIEPQEYDAYAAVIDRQNLLVLPFSNLGQGSIPARNWVWEHALAAGHRRHWILDDNIRDFWRRYRGQRIRTTSGTTFKVIEDFVERYENIALAGMQYKMFVTETDSYAPIIFNTRIYSCILIKNDLPYRWRGRYNEDTDLSLRILKDGWCTALFTAFPAEKMQTMTMKGGNTEDLYKLEQQDGRYLMAFSLWQQHPDVTKILRKWNRWQHSVNYRPFKANKLIRKPGIELSDSANEYGMILRHTA
jgi:hypothetical protein